MSDYEFEKVDFKLRAKGNNGEPIDVDYPFEAYLAEFVWNYPKWGEDGWDEAQIRIGEAIEVAPTGGKFQLSLDDTEKFKEANKAATITGVHAPRLRKYQRSIKSATKVKEA